MPVAWFSIEASIFYSRAVLCQKLDFRLEILRMGRGISYLWRGWVFVAKAGQIAVLSARVPPRQQKVHLPDVTSVSEVLTVASQPAL